MNKLLFAFFLFIGLFLSCTSKLKNVTEENKLTVDLNKPESNLSFFDVFDSVKIIPLEFNNESIIAEIEKIDLYNRRYYVLDKKTKTLFLFNEQGKYLNKIKRHGNGPGEYANLSDFTVNRFTGNIELLSSYGGLYIYDNDLNFIKQIPLSADLFPVHKFAIIDKNTRVFFNYFRKNRIQIHSENENRVLNEFYEMPIFINKKSVLGGKMQLEKEGGTTYFTQPYRYELFEVKADSLKIKFIWDFKDHNYSIQSLSDNWSINEYQSFFWDKMINEKKIFFFTANIENSEYCICQFPFETKENLTTIVYDKKSAKSKIINSFNEGVKFPYYPVFKTDSLILISGDSKLALSSYVNDKIINKEYIDSLTFDKEDYNPYILLYSLKKNIFK